MSFLYEGGSCIQYYMREVPVPVPGVLFRMNLVHFCQCFQTDDVVAYDVGAYDVGAGVGADADGDTGRRDGGVGSAPRP